MKIKATQLNKTPGRILDIARQEPVIIEKNSRPIVVILDYNDFLSLESILIDLKNRSDKRNSWPKGFFNFESDPTFPSIKELRKGLRTPKEVNLL